MSLEGHLRTTNNCTEDWILLKLAARKVRRDLVEQLAIFQMYAQGVGQLGKQETKQTVSTSQRPQKGSGKSARSPRQLFCFLPDQPEGKVW